MRFVTKTLLSLLLMMGAAYAQSGASVKQSGNVTPGQIPWWVTSGVIGGGVSSADSPVTSFGVTNNGGAGFCVNSARSTAVGRNALCLGAATAGPATISLQNYGSALPQALEFIINGTTYNFPFVTSGIIGPNTTVIGDVMCWNNTSGTLAKDCGPPFTGGTGVTQWDLMTRPAITTFPVPRLRPTTVGSPIAFDTMPRGASITPVFGGQIAWHDITDQDFDLNPSVTSRVATWGIATDRVWFGTRNFAGATTLPLVFEIGSTGLGTSDAGAFTATKVFTVGKIVTDNGATTGVELKPDGTVLAANTSTISAVGAGQSPTRNVQLQWIPGTGGQLATWTYTDPLVIDASTLTLQGGSLGQLKVGTAYTFNNNGNLNSIVNSGTPWYLVGESSTLNILLQWVNGVGGQLATWAYSSPIAIDGSVLNLNTSSLGSIVFGSSFATPVPTTKTANYTLVTTDGSLIFNCAGSCTLTLQAAASFPGRWLSLKTIANQTVVSNASNVVPLAGGGAGTAILSGTAGKWARLQSDGTNWIIMESN